MKNEFKITDAELTDAMDAAYLKAGHNAYFGNGFNAGVEFALKLVNGVQASDEPALPIQNVSGSLPFKDDIELAKWMHDTYEEISLEVGWDTQQKCKTTFDKLPTENKITMIEVAGRLLTKLRQ